MLAVAEPYLVQNMHPTILVAAYNNAMEEALAVVDKLAFKIDVADREQLLSIVRSCIGRYLDLCLCASGSHFSFSGTKFVSRYGDLMCNLALNAVFFFEFFFFTNHDRNVKRFWFRLLQSRSIKRMGKKRLIWSAMLELRRCATLFMERSLSCSSRFPVVIWRTRSCLTVSCSTKISLIPKCGDTSKILEFCCEFCIRGFFCFVFWLLVFFFAFSLDSNLEYKKGESMTNIELSKDTDFSAVLKQEEQFIEEVCKKIISVRPDIVCTEKGISGMTLSALHFSRYLCF